MGTDTNPKVVTIKGRLSFPRFTAQEAYDASQGSQYPYKSVAEAKPDINLLLEQAQHDKLMTKIVDEFLPYCAAQAAAGEKKDKLDQSEVDDILAQLAKPDFKGPQNIPFRPMSDKSKALAPECVSSARCLGNAGVDLVLKGVVNDEKELAVPDPDQIKFPVIKPINDTVHSFYPGALVAVTINLYAYHNGKVPGFSAGISAVVFWADADRFGGGVAVDEDAIFMD